MKVFQIIDLILTTLSNGLDSKKLRTERIPVYTNKNKRPFSK